MYEKQNDKINELKEQYKVLIDTTEQFRTNVCEFAVNFIIDNNLEAQSIENIDGVPFKAGLYECEDGENHYVFLYNYDKETGSYNGKIDLYFLRVYDAKYEINSSMTDCTLFGACSMFRWFQSYAKAKGIEMPCHERLLADYYKFLQDTAVSLFTDIIENNVDLNTDFGISISSSNVDSAVISKRFKIAMINVADNERYVLDILDDNEIEGVAPVDVVSLFEMLSRIYIAYEYVLCDFGEGTVADWIEKNLMSGKNGLKIKLLSEAMDIVSKKHYDSNKDYINDYIKTIREIYNEKEYCLDDGSIEKLKRKFTMPGIFERLQIDGSVDKLRENNANTGHYKEWLGECIKRGADLIERMETPKEKPSCNDSNSFLRKLSLFKPETTVGEIIEMITC